MKQRHLIKFISVLLTLVLFTLAVPFAANAAEAADVMDEGAKTFRIATAEGLKRLSSECSAKGNWKGWTITLEADIVLNTGDKADWETTAPANVWTPVENFSGTFDGQGHSISGVYVKGGGGSAFFAIVEGATIKNFQLVNSYFCGSSYPVAAIAGHSYWNTALYENLVVDAIVKNTSAAEGYTGGITGYVHHTQKATTLRNVVMLGSVSASGVCVGGLIGMVLDNESLVMENCLNAASVQSNKEYNGGLVGLCRFGNVTMTGCVSIGAAKSTTMATGALFGGARGSTIKARGCLWGGNAPAVPMPYSTTTTIDGESTGTSSEDGAADGQIISFLGKEYQKIDLFTETGASLRATVGSTGLRWESKIEKKAYDALSALPCVESVALGTLITPTQFAAKAGGMTREKLETLNKAVKYLDVPMTAGAWFRSSDTHYGFAGSVGEISDPSHFNLKYSGIGYLTLRFAGGLSVTLTADYNAENHSRTVAYVAQAALADADNGLTAEQIAAITPYASAYDSSKEY